MGLVRLICDESGAVIDWYGDRLANAGLPFGMSRAIQRTNPAISITRPDIPDWEGSDDGTGNVLDGNKVLFDYASNLGAEFRTAQNDKAVKDNGRVTGCIAENSDGRYIRYSASKGDCCHRRLLFEL